MLRRQQEPVGQESGAFRKNETAFADSTSSYSPGGISFTIKLLEHVVALVNYPERAIINRAIEENADREPDAAECSRLSVRKNLCFARLRDG